MTETQKVSTTEFTTLAVENNRVTTISDQGLEDLLGDHWNKIQDFHEGNRIIFVYERKSKLQRQLQRRLEKSIQNR